LNPADVPENDAEENNLAAEPQHFHQHPKDKIRFETHLTDERVAQHDGVNFEVTPHPFRCNTTLSVVSQLLASANVLWKEAARLCLLRQNFDAFDGNALCMHQRGMM
jgi:hypothetical protein